MVKTLWCCVAVRKWSLLDGFTLSPTNCHSYHHRTSQHTPRSWLTTQCGTARRPSSLHAGNDEVSSKKSTANQSKEHNVEEYVQWVIMLSPEKHGSIFIFGSCCLPNWEIPRNSQRIRTYNTSRSSKVIDLGVNRKCIYDFLLVINSNFKCISYRLQDIDV